MVLVRRLMLSQVYSIYDPLGLLSPITIKYKLILQRMVVEGLEWDTELHDEILEVCQTILEEMLLVGEIVVPQGVVPEGSKLTDLGLVGFSDGGNPASAATLYM